MQATNSLDFLLIPESESIIKLLPKPYERKIITEQELINFIKTSTNQPIVIFGANWCPDCQILTAVLSLPSVKQYIDVHFSIMLVDLGRYDINMNVLEAAWKTNLEVRSERDWENLKGRAVSDE